MKILKTYFFQVTKPPEENNQKPEEDKTHDTTGVEQQGVGKADEAERNTKEGHSSEQNKGSESREKGNKEQKRKLKPGESDINRSLGLYFIKEIPFRSSKYQCVIVY